MLYIILMHIPALKKEIWPIFLFKFKMGHKAGETTHNTSNAFGPETADQHTVQWWFKKFCKWDENPEDEECSDQPIEADNQLRGSRKPILVQPHKNMPKNSVSTILGCLAFEENWKGEKVQ